MNNTATSITLRYPVQLADKTLTEVTLRRPTMGDVMDHPINGDRDVKGEASLLATLCGMKTEELRLLDLADYQQLQVQLVRFQSGTEQA